MKLWQKLRHLAGRRSRVARLEEEMQHHLELLVEENVRRGLDRTEARRQAHLAFGNVLATREESEDAMGWPSGEAWVQDLRVAWRGLRRRPGFALSLLAVLALGIGVTTAVFSLVRGVLLEPLRVPAPEELALVREPGGDPYLLSAPAIDRLALSPELAGRVAGYSSMASVALRIDNSAAEPCAVQFVNGTFFPALRAPVVRGRALGPGDDTLDAAAAVAVASHRFWQTKLGGADDAVGRTVRLNGQTVTIVGVAASGFDGVALGESPDLWLPLGQHAPLQCSPSAWLISDGPIKLSDWRRIDNAAWVFALVRVPPGATGAAGAVEAAWRPQLDAALRIVTEPQLRQDFQARVPRLVPSPQGYSSTRDDFRRVGLTLTLLVAAVVLVTLANSATLLLLRVLGRGRELGVRLALGAGPWRLARVVLLEGVLLSFGGAAVGVLLALWLTPLLAAWLVPAAGPSLPGLDWPLLAGLAGLALVLGLVMGAGPAWLSARLSPQSILQQRFFGAGGSLRLGRGLIVAQLALSVMLISIAGALALDVRRVLARNPGYERTQVIQAFFDLGAAGIPVERQAAVLANLRAAAAELPPVRGVGFAASGVLSNSRSRSGLYFRGEGVRQPRDNVQHESADAAYFSAMGLAIVRGRGFAATDDAKHPPVALISERLAREVFGDADPIGRRVGFDQEASAEDREIVGIVADARVNGVRDEAPAMFYTALDQWQARPRCLVVQVAGEAAAVRETLQRRIAAAEPGILFTRWATLEERAQRWMRNDLATVRLTAGFGALATLLAVVGVLGALGYLVASRSRDIAVRLAVGAEPSTVWRGIVREAFGLGAVGALVGVGLAVALPRWLGSWMMTGLKVDFLAIGLAAAAGLLAAVIGGLLPARRAAKVDPLTLLKAD